MFNSLATEILNQSKDIYNQRFLHGWALANWNPQLGMLGGLLKNTTMTPYVTDEWMWANASTIYNLCAFGSAILVITSMICFGTQVNKLKVTHEFYTEKISEEKQRQSEAQEREAAKALQESKKLMGTAN